MKQVSFIFILFICVTSLWSQTTENQLRYLEWMQQSLPNVPEWTAWQHKTAELPPDFYQLPRSNLLPDPFHFSDGSTVKNNAEDWQERCVEIRQLFEKYVTGTFPPKPPIDRVVLLEEIKSDGYLTRNVRVEFGPQSKGSVRVRLIIPEVDEGEKIPALISSNLEGYGQLLIRREYISVGFAGNDWMDDAASLEALYPDMILLHCHAGHGWFR
jgi:hypothetical protein